MENQKNDNLNLLEAVVQNTEMGKNTLEQIVPMTDDVQFKAELLRQHYRLSARETEVMELIARGNSMAAIAERLVISENTVRTHAKHIYTKLDIHRRQELLDMLRELGN